MMSRSTFARIAMRMVLAAGIAYCALLLSLAHAYPWQPWSTLALTAMLTFVGCVAGAAAFATILIAWARAQ